MVVDSTDRERISVTKEELYRMLAHEVSVAKMAVALFQERVLDVYIQVNNTNYTENCVT